MARTYLRGRLQASRRTAVLAIGDLGALVAFATASTARHGGGVYGAVETAGQFGIGWAIAAVAIGAYAPGAVDGWRRGAGLGVGAWTLGAVLGSLVRAATEPGAGLSPVFVLVVVAVGSVLFGGWRAAAAAVLGAPDREDYADSGGTGGHP